MNKQKRFSLKARLASFRYAFSGFCQLLKTEHNARIHMVAALIAVMLGMYFNLTKNDWIFLVFAIGFVFSMELMNSSIEYLADRVEPKQDYLIKHCKDLAAAGVLVAALTASIVGCIVFGPYFIALRVF